MVVGGDGDGSRRGKVVSFVFSLVDRDDDVDVPLLVSDDHDDDASLITSLIAAVGW